MAVMLESRPMNVFELKVGVHPNSGFSCSLKEYLVETILVVPL